MVNKRELGIDNWPPVPSESLKRAKNAWEHGNPWGLIDALLIWRTFFPKEVFPQWMLDASLTAATICTKLGEIPRHSHQQLPRYSKGDQKKFFCYAAVRLAMREKKTGDARFERAVELLKEAGLQLKFDTVQKYHKMVLAELKTVDGQARYHAFTSPILWKRFRTA